MKDRIRQWMDYEGLNAAQFSKKVNINTSVLSHLLSGRNMPSYDIVQKIVTNCPELNIDWFITGNGPMVRPESASEENSEKISDTAPVATYPSLFEGEEPDRSQTTENSKKRTIVRPQVENGREKEVKRTKNTSKTTDNQSDNLRCNTSRQIRKIVVLYEDNTFEEFSSNFVSEPILK